MLSFQCREKLGVPRDEGGDERVDRGDEGTGRGLGDGTAGHTGERAGRGDDAGSGGKVFGAHASGRADEVDQGCEGKGRSEGRGGAVECDRSVEHQTPGHLSRAARALALGRTSVALDLVRSLVYPGRGRYRVPDPGVGHNPHAKGDPVCKLERGFGHHSRLAGRTYYVRHGRAWPKYDLGRAVQLGH